MDSYRGGDRNRDQKEERQYRLSIHTSKITLYGAPSTVTIEGPKPMQVRDRRVQPVEELAKYRRICQRAVNDINPDHS